MNTIKATFTVQPYEEWVCAVIMAELSVFGFNTFVDTDTGFEAYIPENLYQEEDLVWMKKATPEGHELSYSLETIPAQNWNEEWEKNYFKPLVIGDQVVVRAPFHTDYPDTLYEIVIEPKMAFGTGNHETTSLMMETLLELDLEGKKLLDMGCGTGILAILASMCGADPITAIDIDEWSFEATIENSTLNGAGNIKVLLGDASLLGEETYDVLLANIQKNIILADIEVYARVLNPGGILITSGFYQSDLPDIQKAATDCGLDFLTFEEKNQWVMAMFSK
jgi:ribosomal protein L11 methyltransferase